MNYEIYGTPITRNATFITNQDGSLRANGVVVQVQIVGAIADKFIQTDIIPAFDIPASTTTANQPAYVEQVALDYISATYPNS